MDEKINKQVEEEPLTKEESRAQFVKITNELGIKHSFNFDEAWAVSYTHLTLPTNREV